MLDILGALGDKAFWANISLMKYNDSDQLFGLSILYTLKIHICIFFLLAVATVTSVAFLPQYSRIGQERLLNGSFQTLTGWKTSAGSGGNVIVADGVAVLRNDNAEKSVNVWQSQQIREGGALFLLEANLATDGVVKGEKSWNTARLTMVQSIDDKAQYGQPHVVVELEGTHSTQKYSKVLGVLPSATSLKVVAQLSRCVGLLEVSAISMHRVVPSGLFLLVKRMLLGGWALFFIFVVYARLKGNYSNTLMSFLVLMMMVAIVVGTSMPGEMKERIKKDVVEIVAVGVVPVEAALEKANVVWSVPSVGVDITKGAHFVLFALLASGMVLLGPLLPGRTIAAELAMLAVGTEIVQFLIDGRSPLLMDVLIDMSGAGFGIFLIGVWRAFRRG